MISIRLAHREDVSEMLAIYRPIVLETHISFEYEVPSERDFAERVDRTLEKYPWLVLKDGNNLMGYAYASALRGRIAYQWTVETSVYVHPGYRKKGVAVCLYESLLACLREMGYLRAFAIVCLPNDPSVEFHRRMEFRQSGTFPNVGYKFGQWWDTTLWERWIQPPDSTPGPLKHWSEIPEHLLNAALEAGLTYLKN
ncbi:N-acetyltransferase family protein [Pontibacter sp. G13]|uniref:GNAT family N-acetyltransferase n=1 Tax=Pontibacter sp. G13 TaxID=3074898 RepID=UPI00288AB4C8|nr:N-acetyltransferase family protein [Pontibacter sp. G13]WNJ18884.1 GNAT family N-acetyltransferase [Pontibacter sp. G13]